MNFLKDVAEYFTPVLKESHFHQKGVLTPDEFVLAGDELVGKCKTWQWASGDKTLLKPFLPPNKQYLVTKNVPCMKRASVLATTELKEKVVESSEDGDWIAASMTEDNKSGEKEKVDSQADMQEIPEMTQKLQQASIATTDSKDDDIPDMEAFEDHTIKDDDTATLAAPSADTYLTATEPEDNIFKTRTYDISITYDKYYQTPRVYLFGYDENRQPLNPEQVMEDVSGDHANKTATIETHPHLGVPNLSIHPCKHASVMLRLLDHLSVNMGSREPEESKEKGGPSTSAPSVPRIDVSQYMFLFLKFISSVIPTVEYDFTSSF